MSASRPSSDGPLEAYCTSGTSPGWPTIPNPPTLHLLGVGAVGRALLRRLPTDRFRLVAVSDTSGTLSRPEGLNAARVADLKERTGRVSPSVRPLASGDVSSIGADIVVDATSTVLGRSEWTGLLDREVLDRGAHLVLAAKDGLRARAPAWTGAGLAARVRYNAVLGGAGAQLRDELPVLRDDALGVAIAGNATTTTIIDAIETGASLVEGIGAARRAGLLETDPELDFKGVDAALKLAIVVGSLWGFPVAVDAVAADDVRALDPAEVRERARSGLTTRLVARGERHGPLQARFEAVPRGHWLDVPPDRVVYGYELGDGETRVHVGDGLGADRTAAAAQYDLDQIVAERVNSAAGVGGAR